MINPQIYRELKTVFIELEKSKHNSNVNKSKVCEKTVSAVTNYLNKANLYDSNTEKTLQAINDKLKELPESSQVKACSDRITAICKNLTFIRQTHIQRKYIDVGHVKHPDQAPLKAPKNLSVATLIIDEYQSDVVLEDIFSNAMEETTPVVIPEALFCHVLPSIENCCKNFEFFKSKEGRLIVCLPKQANVTPIQLLQKGGYDPNFLTHIPLKHLSKALNSSGEQSHELYQQQIATAIPKLFSDQTSSRSIKKRFHIVGHGKSIASADKVAVAGLTIPQFTKMLSELETKGMDYVNYMSCYGGGKNLMEVFDSFEHKFTASVCSLEDIPVRLRDRFIFKKDGGNIKGLENLNLKIHCYSFKKFWEAIISLDEDHPDFTKKIQPKDFEQALRAIYGYDLSALPSIAIGGEQHFQQLTLGTAQSLDYPDLLANELLLDQKTSPPFTSIDSNWAKSPELADKINHCEQQISLWNKWLLAYPTTGGHSKLEITKQAQRLTQAYETLKSFYQSRSPTIEIEDALIQQQIQTIQHLEESIQAEESLISTSPLQPTPISVHSQGLLVFPQVVKTKIEIKQNQENRLYPIIVSKIPDNNQIYFSEIKGEGEDIKEFMAQTLMGHSLYMNARKHYNSSIYAIKRLEFQTTGESNATFKVLHHVLTCQLPEGSKPDQEFAIYQKEGSDQWYYLNEKLKESAISDHQAAILIYNASKQVTTSDKAVKWSSSSLPAAKHKNIQFIEAFEEAFFDKMPKEDLKTLRYLEKNDKNIPGSNEIKEALNFLEKSQKKNFKESLLKLNAQQLKEVLFDLVRMGKASHLEFILLFAVYKDVFSERDIKMLMNFAILQKNPALINELFLTFFDSYQPNITSISKEMVDLNNELELDVFTVIISNEKYRRKRLESA